MDIDKIIELEYDKIETDEGTFYKGKNNTSIHTHVGYTPSPNAYSDEKQKLGKIVTEKVEEYIKPYTSESYPEEKRIKDEYYIDKADIYFTNNSDSYNDGDDIIALVDISAIPVNGNNNYWKDNFTNNEFFYSEYDEEYYLRTYFFVRLSLNSETKEYEIAYIGREPENYKEYIAELKETKGIDLENLDIERILNTKYTDDIEIVSSTSTVDVVNGEQSTHNGSNMQEISNFATLIRVACIAFMIIIIGISLIKRKK